MRTSPARSIWIVGAATIAVAIGSVMPWITAQWAVGRMTVTGTDGDGRVTIVAATAAVIAIAVGAKIRSRHQLLPALGLLAGAIVAATAIYDTVTIRHNIGAGLWIVDAGAVVLIAGAMQALHEVSIRRDNADFESLLPRPTGDMVVTRTVVVTMPTQREPDDVPSKRAGA
jgi:hypothetical protein